MQISLNSNNYFARNCKKSDSSAKPDSCFTDNKMSAQWLHACVIIVTVWLHRTMQMRPHMRLILPANVSVALVRATWASR